MKIATQRRLMDELHVECELEFVYKFDYQASFGDAGSENELCHVHLGRVSKEIRPNDHEIASIRFISAADLDREFVERPETLTPWFAMEWRELTSKHRSKLQDYARL